MMAYYLFIKDNLSMIAIICIVAILLFVVELLFVIQQPDVKPSSLLPEMPQYVDNNHNSKQLLIDDLSALYAKYDAEVTIEDVEASISSKGMDKEQQLLQHGNLTQLYIGEYKYQLIGTFSTINKNSALLTVNHVISNMIETKEIKRQEKIGDWQVATITKNSIEFVNGQRTVTLQIFKRLNAK